PSPPPASRPNCAAPPVPADASPPPSALPQRRLPSIPPPRLRPPARSMRPACEDRDTPAKPPSAHHRSTPTPPSESSLESIQTEPTLHRFESHPSPSPESGGPEQPAYDRETQATWRNPPTPFESILVNRPLTIEDSALSAKNRVPFRHRPILRTNQRIATDSASQPLVTRIFSRLPCR